MSLTPNPINRNPIMRSRMDGRRDNLTRVFLVVNEARDELTHFSK